MKNSLFLLFFLGCTLNALELKTDQWDKKARPVKNDPAALSISSKVVMYSMATPYIPVDPAKKYRLNGRFRLAEPLPAKPGKLKFGVQTYDKDKRLISSEHTTVINRTATTLVKDAEYGQRTVTIANGKTWRIIPNFSCIAFITIFESELDVEAEEEENEMETTVRRENNDFYVEGKWLYDLLGRTNLDSYESLTYFQRSLIKGGVIKLLEEKGCTDGHTVHIYDFEFEFIK